VYLDNTLYDTATDIHSESSHTITSRIARTQCVDAAYCYTCLSHIVSVCICAYVLGIHVSWVKNG